MHIRHSKPVFTTLFAAIALSATTFAGAAEFGLSHNEQAARNTIVETTATPRASASHDVGVATLAQNESAAQRAIVVDYSAVANPVAARDEAASLVINEHAAQRAIHDAPRTDPRMTKHVATMPVAVR